MCEFLIIKNHLNISIVCILMLDLAPFLSSEILRSIGMTFIWIFIIDLGFDESNEGNNETYDSIKNIIIISVLVAFFGSEIIQYFIPDLVSSQLLIGILTSFKLFFTTIGLLSLIPVLVLKIYLFIMVLVFIPTEIPLSRRVKHGY